MRQNRIHPKKVKLETICFLPSAVFFKIESIVNILNWKIEYRKSQLLNFPLRICRSGAGRVHDHNQLLLTGSALLDGLSLDKGKR